MDNDYDRVGLGKRIRHYRNQKKLTQLELAAQIHISKNHLSLIERGLTATTFEVLLNIADILHVTLNDLMLDSLLMFQVDIKSDNAIIQKIMTEAALLSDENLKYFTQIVEAFFNENTNSF